MARFFSSKHHSEVLSDKLGKRSPLPTAPTPSKNAALIITLRHK